MPSIPPTADAAAVSESKGPSAADSPRLINVTEVTANARAQAVLIKAHLDNVFVDSSNLIEFDVAIKTGKVLMQVRGVFWFSFFFFLTPSVRFASW